MSPPRPVDMGSVRLSVAAAATAPSAALPPSRRTATAASLANFWLVAAAPLVTTPPGGAPPQPVVSNVEPPRARGTAAAPARNSRREGCISLLYAVRGADGEIGRDEEPPLA